MGKSLVGELFRSYHGELLRLATRLVGDRSMGEEVVQDTFLRLIGGQVQVASIESPRHYLLVAARNIAFDARSRSAREWSRRVDIAEIEDVLDLQSDPDLIYSHRQRLRMLADALNELPEDCRTAFFLNRVEGLRHREIAEILSVSIWRIDRLVARALLHCHQKLGDSLNIF